VEFEEVVYWPRIVEIIEWSHQHVTSTLFLCWAVQAALKALYGMEKQTHGEKLSGVYRHHRLDEHEALLRGFDDEFVAPHSRYAAFDGDLIRAHTDLQIFAESEEAGVYLAATKDCRQVFVTGHPEYDALTLDGEYRRDLAAGLTPVIPVNYYPDNDPSQTRAPPGAATVTCCFPTGSTITSTS
jgi:homoserine O-succinyltransferase